MRALVVLAIASALLFCIALKWQPWHSRLELPMFALSAVAIAAFLRTSKPAAFIAASVCIALAAQSAYFGNAKTLFGERSALYQDRLSLLFAHRPALKAPTLQTADFLIQRKPKRVGLIGFVWEWEYPLERQVLEVLNKDKRRPQFNTFATWDPPAADRSSPAAAPPDVIVAMNWGPARFVHPISGAAYVAVQSVAPYTIYLPDETKTAAGEDRSQTRH
jgi:hypothetical protein